MVISFRTVLQPSARQMQGMWVQMISDRVLAFAVQGVVYSRSLNTGWKPPARLRQMTQVWLSLLLNLVTGLAGAGSTPSDTGQLNPHGSSYLTARDLPRSSTRSRACSVHGDWASAAGWDGKHSWKQGVLRAAG